MCKVLIYRDGVEIRAMFTRYFLPHDKYVEPPCITGMFSNTLLFRTSLPGVPETIRIKSRHVDENLGEIERARAG